MSQPDASDLHVPGLVRAMPYATEHAARQQDPKKYMRLRRKKLTKGVDAVIGFDKSGTSEIQSLRFDAEQFSTSEAKQWLKDHGFSTSLEEAVEKSVEAGLFILEKAQEKRYTLGVVYEPDVLDTQKEFAKAEDIEKAAWAFMERLQTLAKTSVDLVKWANGVLDGTVEDEFDIRETEEVLKASGLDDEHLQIGEDQHLGTIVESYIAPVDMVIEGETVKKGSWLLGVRWTESMFEKIKKGQRTGFSMYGRADRIKEA